MQLELHRSALEEREKSHDREARILRDEREAAADAHRVAAADFERARLEWEKARLEHEKSLELRESQIAGETRGLELRRLRIDQLRREVEETHARTLAQRLAIEEVWADVARSLGDTQTNGRLDAAKTAISEWFDGERARVAADHREVLEQRADLERERADLSRERQELKDWLVERDAELESLETRLQETELALIDREQACRQQQLAWLDERAEAETVIRKLLTELTSRQSYVDEITANESSGDAWRPSADILRAALNASDQQPEPEVPRDRWGWSESRDRTVS
jgi:hypothetical protein